MEPVAVTPPRQPFLPYPRDLTGVPAQASSVTRYAAVGIVAAVELAAVPVHFGQPLQ